jgi:hypothetical protein
MYLLLGKTHAFSYYKKPKKGLNTSGEKKKNRRENIENRRNRREKPKKKKERIGEE